MSSSSSSDPNKPATIRQSKSPPFKFLVPLIYAPVLPLIRLSLRHKPVLRDRLFVGVLVGAFVHGSYLVLIELMRLSYATWRRERSEQKGFCICTAAYESIPEIFSDMEENN